MEAVIAIIIVFGIVLAVLPKIEKTTYKIPPDLELIAKTILDDAQNDENFRKCFLGVPRINYPKCVSEEVENGLGKGTLWKHAEKICKVDSSGIEDSCGYKIDGLDKENENLFLQALPKDKDIYTKSVTIKVPDVTSSPSSEIIIEKDTQLRIYFWSK